MEKTLDELKKDMEDAKQAFNNFKINHSREMTDKEKQKSPNSKNTKIFELKKEFLAEYHKLEQAMREAHGEYVKEFINKNTK